MDKIIFQLYQNQFYQNYHQKKNRNLKNGKRRCDYSRKNAEGSISIYAIL
jgi:hypothetical protein